MNTEPDISTLQPLPCGCEGRHRCAYHEGVEAERARIADELSRDHYRLACTLWNEGGAVALVRWLQSERKGEASS